MVFVSSICFILLIDCKFNKKSIYLQVEIFAKIFYLANEDN